MRGSDSGKIPARFGLPGGHPSSSDNVELSGIRYRFTPYQRHWNSGKARVNVPPRRFSDLTVILRLVRSRVFRQVERLRRRDLYTCVPQVVRIYQVRFR